MNHPLVGQGPVSEGHVPGYGHYYILNENDRALTVHCNNKESLTGENYADTQNKTANYKMKFDGIKESPYLMCTAQIRLIPESTQKN